MVDIAIMAAILPVAAVLGLAMTTFPSAAKLFNEDLLQVHRLRWWDRPAATIQAATTDPQCALHYQAGDTWTIDEHGAVSPVLCQAAARAVEDRAFPGAATSDVDVVCRCPLVDREVRFTVHPTAAPVASHA